MAIDIDNLDGQNTDKILVASRLQNLEKEKAKSRAKEMQ